MTLNKDGLEAARDALRAEGVHLGRSTAANLIRAYLSATALPDGMEVVGYHVRRLTDEGAAFSQSLRFDPERASATVVVTPLVSGPEAQSALAAMRVERDEAKEAALSNFNSWKTAVEHFAESEAQVQRLTEDNEALRKERGEADNALVDKYRDPKTGQFNFPSDVAAIVRRLDARDARIKALEEALRPFADKPDDWTVDQVNAGRLALKNQESDRG